MLQQKEGSSASNVKSRDGGAMNGQDTHQGKSRLQIPDPEVGRLESGEQSGVLGKKVIAEQTKQMEVDW